MTTERVAVDAKPMTINQDIERKIIEINQQVATIPEVNSDEARSIAASLVAFSTRLIADAEADYKPHLATLRKPWDDKCKELREWKVRAGTPREILEPMIINYDRKRRLIAAEEQRKADEAARRQAEADRKAEIAKLKKTEPAEAKALAKAPVVVPQLAPVMPPPREKGVHTKQTWDAELVDLPALIKAIAAGKAPENFVIFNGSKAVNYGRATDGKMPVPGVRFYQKEGLSIRKG